MLPTISRPTRVTEYSATLIDNIFINTVAYITKSYVLWDEFSDHFSIILQIDITTEKKRRSVSDAKRSFNENNKSVFFNKISKVDWTKLSSQCLVVKNTDLLYDNFFNVFLLVFEECFPLRNVGNLHTRKSKNIRPEWLT